MIFELLFHAPLVALAYAVALITALTIHEFAHAGIGKLLGDRTAEHLGRLTLNPLAHIDLVGLLMLFTLGFGWAKPVPFDPRRLTRPLRDGVVIALAGPAANLVFALGVGMAFQGILGGLGFGIGSFLPAFLIFLVLINLMLMFFNLLPIPPLDGSHVVDAVLHAAKWRRAQIWFEAFGQPLLLFLVVVSLLTPLDPFAFVTKPAFFACDQIIQSSCAGVLNAYFEG